MASNQTTELTVPYTTSGETYAASTVLPLLGIIFVTLRIYSRLLQKAGLGVDDWLMLPALVLVIGMGATLIIGVHGQAIGYPTPYGGNLSPEQELVDVNPIIELMGQIQYAFILLMVLASGFIKLSIAFFYRRLFVTAKNTLFDWATKAAIVIVCLWITTFFFGSMFDCGIHLSSNWGSVEDTLAYCGAATSLDNGFVVSDLITDVIILCLPLPVIWTLHMTTGQKVLVSAILATGAVSIIASVIKVVVSYEITNAGFNTNVDPDLTVSTILFWSMIEAGLAIIAACLPTLRFLVRKVSLDSIINTVRSALSLNSLQSQRSRRSAAPWEGPYTNIQAEGSAASRAQMVPEKTQRNEFGMADMEGPATGSGIRVTNQISQHDSIV